MRKANKNQYAEQLRENNLKFTKKKLLITKQLYYQKVLNLFQLPASHKSLLLTL